LILRTKPDDTVYQVDRRVTTMRQLNEALKDTRANRIEVAPTRLDMELQQAMMARAIDAAWRQGGWTVDLDELLFLHRLGLMPVYERLFTQTRSLKVTAMCGMQRPVQVSRFALSQSRHVISFLQEGRDVATIAEATTPRMKDVIPNLTIDGYGEYSFAWFERRSRKIYIARLDVENDRLEELGTA